MTLLDSLAIAIRALKTNLMRSFPTTLGTRPAPAA